MFAYSQTYPSLQGKSERQRDEIEQLKRKIDQFKSEIQAIKATESASAVEQLKNEAASYEKQFRQMYGLDLLFLTIGLTCVYTHFPSLLPPPFSLLLSHFRRDQHDQLVGQHESWKKQMQEQQDTILGLRSDLKRAREAAKTAGVVGADPRQSQEMVELKDQLNQALLDKQELESIVESGDKERGHLKATVESLLQQQEDLKEQLRQAEQDQMVNVQVEYSKNEEDG